MVLTFYVSRKNGKSSNAPPRRIKPTSLQSTPHTPSQFTTSTPHSQGTPSPWKSSPSFAIHSTFSDSLSPSGESQSLIQIKHKDHSPKNQNKVGAMSACKAPFFLQKLEQRISGNRVNEDSLEIAMKMHSISSLTNSKDLSSENISTSNISSSSLDVSSSMPIKVTSPLLPLPVQPALLVSYDRVSIVQLVKQVASLYSSFIMEGKVPNLTSQIHFIIQLLTISHGNTRDHQFMQGKIQFTLVNSK